MVGRKEERREGRECSQKGCVDGQKIRKKVKSLQKSPGFQHIHRYLWREYPSKVLKTKGILVFTGRESGGISILFIYNISLLIW